MVQRWRGSIPAACLVHKLGNSLAAPPYEPREGGREGGRNGTFFNYLRAGPGREAARGQVRRAGSSGWWGLVYARASYSESPPTPFAAGRRHRRPRRRRGAGADRAMRRRSTKSSKQAATLPLLTNIESDAPVSGWRLTHLCGGHRRQHRAHPSAVELLHGHRRRRATAAAGASARVNTARPTSPQEDSNHTDCQRNPPSPFHARPVPACAITARSLHSVAHSPGGTRLLMLAGRPRRPTAGRGADTEYDRSYYYCCYGWYYYIRPRFF